MNSNKSPRSRSSLASSSNKSFQPSSNPTTMEDSVITLPIVKSENFDVAIGSLWDCRKSEGTGLNIFRSEELNDKEKKDEYLEVLPSPDMQYTMTRVRDANGKSELLDISVEVKIELPQLTVEGGVFFTKDESRHYEQEEFYFQYNVQTSILRTRSKVLDPTVAEKLISPGAKDVVLKGDNATHYVSEIRYGGWATGNFRLSDTMTHDLLDLGGYVGGAVPIFAGISIGIKASFAFLDEDGKENFSKVIEIQGNPVEFNGGGVSTMKEMFQLMESLPEAIDGTTWENWETLIKGVPITVKLSPISQLLEMPDGYKTYNILETKILQDMQEMVFHLTDFLTNNDYYKRLIRQEDPRLVVLFKKSKLLSGSGDSDNPWAVEMRRFEDELMIEGECKLQLIQESFKQYKAGTEGELKKLECILDDFKTSKLHPSNLERELAQHVHEGQVILNHLRPSDSVIAGDPELFVFDSDDWEMLTIPDTTNEITGNTLRLTTNGTIPQGLLIRLYRLIPSLKALWGQELLVRIASPNLDSAENKGVQLFWNIYGNNELRFENNDMFKFLLFLEVVVSSVVESYTNTTRFYTVYSAKNSLGTPSSWGLSIIAARFESIEKRFAEQNITCCDNYLQTLEQLAKKDPLINWTFLLLPQFNSGAHDGMRYFEGLQTALKKKELNINCRTVVGRMDTFGEIGDGPLMLVLNSFSQIVAVCFDGLDFAILTHQLVSTDNLDFQALSPSLIGEYPLDVFKVETAAGICRIISGNDFYPTVHSCPFEELDIPKDIEFNDTLNLFQLLVFNQIKNFVDFACTKGKDKLDGNIASVLKKFGWTETNGFDLLGGDITWADLKSDFERLLNDLRSPPPEGIGNVSFEREEDLKYLEWLVNVTVYAESPSDISLSPVCKTIVDRYFNNIANKGLIHKALDGLFEDIVIPTTILRAIRLFSQLRYNERYYSFCQELDSLSGVRGDEFQDLNNAEKIFTSLGECTLEEQQWVWSNPKFQLWSLEFVNSMPTMVHVFKTFCFKKENDEGIVQDENVDIEGEGAIIHSWFPIKIQELLFTIEENKENPEIKWEKDFHDLDSMLESFADLLVMNNVPEDFTTVLGQNLVKNPALRDFLDVNNLLAHWDPDELFTCGWGFKEIKQVVDFLTQVDDKNSSKIVKVEPKVLLSLSVETDKDTISQLTTSKVRSEIPLNSSWTPFTGGSIKQLTAQDLHSFETRNYKAPLISPTAEDLLNVGGKVVPHLLALLKQGDISKGFNPKSILNFIDYPEPENMDEGENRFFITYSDFLTLFLTCSDQSIRYELMLQLGERKSRELHSLPWIVPNIQLEVLDIVDLSPSLQIVDLGEFYPTEAILGKGLLRSECKIITAIRIGSFQNSRFGKSSILNASLLSFCEFSSRLEPGSNNGLPISRKGLVELAWLSQFTSKPQFYDSVLRDYYKDHDREVFHLANVHGNVLELPESLLKVIRAASGGFVVFWGCDSWSELIDSKLKLDAIIDPNIPALNIILDPDLTIRDKVSKDYIIETTGKAVEGDAWLSFQDSSKIHRLMGKLMETLNLPENPIEEEEILTLIHRDGLSSVRRSLNLQNQPLQNPFPLLRDEVLESFLAIFPDRNWEPRFWKLFHRINQLSLRSNSFLTKTIEDIDSNLDDRGTLTQHYVNALRAIYHQTNFTSLSLLHLERELSLEGGTSVRRAVCQLFLSSFPLEFLNLRFHSNPPFDQNVLTCIFQLENSGKRFLTVSAFGPYGSKRSKLLGQVFPVGFIEGPLIGKLDGVSLRLIWLPEVGDKPFGLEDIDAILCLETEDISSSFTSFSSFSTEVERKMSSLILSMSDIALIFDEPTSKTNSNWIKGLHGILELAFMSASSVFKKHTKFPELLIVNQMQRSRNIKMDDPVDEEIDEDIVESYKFLLGADEIRTMLQNVSNFVAKYPLESSASLHIVDTLTDLYIRVLSNTLNQPLTIDSIKNVSFQSLDKLRKQIVYRLGHRAPVEGWVAELHDNYNSMESHSSLFSFSSASKAISEIDLKSLKSDIQKCYDDTFEKHEDILQRDMLAGDDMESSFPSLTGLPYFCEQLNWTDKDITCDCAHQIPKLKNIEQQERFSIRDKEEIILLQQETEQYTKQLRADIINRLRQEGYALQLIKGNKDGSSLANKLQELIDQGDLYPWVPFKKHVATLLNIYEWEGIIEAEILEEYGEDVVDFVKKVVLADDVPNYAELEALSLNDVGQWGQSPLDIWDRVELTGPFLQWEEYVWIQVQIEIKVTRGGAIYGYKKGMVTQFKSEVNKVLGEALRQILPSEFDILPNFIRQVHFIAIQRYFGYWKQMWEEWRKTGDPLQILEGKKDKFPDIFDNEDQDQ